MSTATDTPLHPQTDLPTDQFPVPQHAQPQAAPFAVQQAMAAGWAAYQAADYPASVRHFDTVLATHPEHADAWHLRGMAQHQQGQSHAALESLTRALALVAHDPALHSNHGLVLRAVQGAEAALPAYARALALKPDFTQALVNRGNALRELRRCDEAAADYHAALRLRPDYAQAMHGLGLVLGDQGQWAQAEHWLAQAVRTQPHFVAAYLDWGNALRELDRYADALASYEQALARNPQYAQAWSNRGVVLKQLGRLQDADQSYQRAIAIHPRFVDALVNWATLLKDMGQVPRAVEMNQRALALDASSAGAHLNQAICYLLLGDLEQGLHHYEWRWQTDQLRDSLRPFAQPQWTGTQSLQGQRILLHAEQGLGDTLQFCRYAKDVAALGAHVILEVQPALLRVLSEVQGVHQLVARGQPLPPFDLHCPLLSVPKALGTRLPTIPSQAATMHVPPERMALWQQRLASLEPAGAVGRLVGHRKLRVGVVWSGRAEHKNDSNRSMPLTDFGPILGCDAEFHCLQKEIRSSDTPFLAAYPQLHVWSRQLEDFTDTAALAQCMDIVVSVDTSVAHLAASLSRPVWLLVPVNPDWRWMLTTEHTPWYPNMQLFRQTAWGDWSQTIASVAQRLAQRVVAPMPAKG